MKFMKKNWRQNLQTFPFPKQNLSKHHQIPVDSPLAQLYDMLKPKSGSECDTVA